MERACSSAAVCYLHGHPDEVAPIAHRRQTLCGLSLVVAAASTFFGPILGTGCSRRPEARFTTLCEIQPSTSGGASGRASLLGESGFERRHTLRESQAALLAKAAARGGQMRSFEVTLFLGDFGEPSLMEAVPRGPLRLRVDDRILERAKAGTAAGIEVRLSLGPNSRFESMDIDLPPEETGGGGLR